MHERVQKIIVWFCAKIHQRADPSAHIMWLRSHVAFCWHKTHSVQLRPLSSQNKDSTVDRDSIARATLSQSRQHQYLSFTGPGPLLGMGTDAAGGGDPNLTVISDLLVIKKGAIWKTKGPKPRKIVKMFLGPLGPGSRRAEEIEIFRIKVDETKRRWCLICDRHFLSESPKPPQKNSSDSKMTQKGLSGVGRKIAQK